MPEKVMSPTRSPASFSSNDWVSSLARSRRDGFTSCESIERERSIAMMISRDWSNTGSSSRPYCGRASAMIAKLRPRNSQGRHRRVAAGFRTSVRS